MMLRFAMSGLLVACAPETNGVSVRLAPDVVSSIDGTLTVNTLVLADREPAEAEMVEITVEYTDRNGVAHAITPASGTTDTKGSFETALTGLEWDGVGTVTAMVAGGPTGSATFAVLDRTAPAVTITPPMASQVRAGNDVNVSVRITDEMGVSRGFFEWMGQQIGRDRSDLVTTGATDVTLDFDFTVPDTAAVGSMITLYALGEDLSGNLAAAAPVTVTVVP